VQITFNINELGFTTHPSKLEAYRRVVEMRDFCGPKNGTQGGRIEKFSWTTPTRRGYETENVCIDNTSGRVVYSVTETGPGAVTREPSKVRKGQELLFDRAQEVPG
jgi:hypothetical protein